MSLPDASSNGHAVLNVMVVEDDPIVTHALGGLLRQAGYQPVIFHAGWPALAYAQSNKPDVALIDIHLPDLSGLVLTSMLRETLGLGVPILVVSGDTTMETLNCLTQVGATYFFSKPLNTKQLLEYIGQLSLK